MEFDTLYEKLLLEISQATRHSALMKHQDMRDRNPIAGKRAHEFSKKLDNDTRNRGMRIEVTNNPKSNKIHAQKDISLENAHEDGDEIIISGMSLYDWGSREERSEMIELSFNPTTGELNQIFNGGHTEKLWLRTRSHAENLARFIRRETGVNVSWKSMNFLHAMDYLNQHGDTRYSHDNTKDFSPH